MATVAAGVFFCQFLQKIRNFRRKYHEKIRDYGSSFSSNDDEYDGFCRTESLQGFTGRTLGL
jgi:hypothetical protein